MLKCKILPLERKKGISLVALAIVIIVTLILSATVILTTVNTSPIEDAKEAVLKNDILNMKEEYELAKSESFFKNMGDETGIKNSDFIGVIPDKYKEDFKALKDEIIYVGDDEWTEKIAAEMGILKKEYNIIEDITVKGKKNSVEIHVTILDTEIADEYIYKVKVKGTNTWEEFSSTSNKLIIDNLLENEIYEVQVVAKQNDKSYESKVKEVETKELKLGTIILKEENENGAIYTENIWTNKDIYVAVEGENTTYSVTGANIVSSTTVPTVLINEGESIVTVKTVSEDKTEEKSKTYTIKIDKGVPQVNELTKNKDELTNENVILSAKAKDSISGITGYMFSKEPNITKDSQGWNTVENAKDEIIKTYEVTENGIYYFFVKDEAGNVEKKEIEVENIDKNAPILESLSVIAPESGEYPDGQEITIQAKYSEKIALDNTILKIKFGTSEEKTLEKGIVNNNVIEYKYVINQDDLGVLTATSYSGSIKDEIQNERMINETGLTGNSITAICPQIMEFRENVKTAFHADEYKTKITKVVFKNDVNTPNDATYWDVSQKQDGNVIAYVEDDKNGGYILTIGGKGKIYANEKSSYLFRNFTALKEIQNINLFDTSKATTLYDLFSGCTNLQNIDVSNFDTTNVTDMTGIFYNCSSLTNLDISTWNTSKVTKLQGLFEKCSNVTSINLSGIDTSNVTNFMKVFSECSSLQSLDLSDFNILNDTDMYRTFYNCKSLTNINFKGIEIIKVKSLRETFMGCNLLTSLDLSNFNTENLTSLDGTFNGCTNLENIVLGDFETSKVTTMHCLFAQCKKLKEVPVESFDTSSVTHMANMFINCSGLTNLDLSHFNTQKVANMRYMFSGCTGLTSLDISSFNTALVTDMCHMFNGCGNLEILDVSNFNTTNVKYINDMFSGCTKVKVLDVSNWDTQNVINMSWVFNNCKGLTNIDIKNWNTSQATSMRGVFCGCSGLTEIDFSNFNTSKVIDITHMFSGCSSLINLDLSNFDTSNVTSLESMFENCKGLTKLDLSSFDTGNVTNMIEVFWGCDNLIKLDVSSFNTSNVTVMRTMFNGCKKLTSLDVSNFDTSNVTDVRWMFAGCINLKTLDFSRWNTSKISYISYMLEDDNNLTANISILSNSFVEKLGIFTKAANVPPAQITVNYTEENESLVDTLIATKSANSNVVKGVQVTAPVEENITLTATVNTLDDGTVTGVYLSGGALNGISSITVFNSNKEVIKEITLDEVLTYSENLDITETGTYEVILKNKYNTKRKITFEI